MAFDMYDLPRAGRPTIAITTRSWKTVYEFCVSILSGARKVGARRSRPRLESPSLFDRLGTL